jgi:hypothetical protein
VWRGRRGAKEPEVGNGYMCESGKYVFGATGLNKLLLGRGKTDTSFKMKNLILCLSGVLLVTSDPLFARGGGGMHGGGGFREEGGYREEGDFREEEGEGYGEGRVEDRDGYGEEDGVSLDREGDDSYRVSDDNGSADVRVNPEGDGVDNVNVLTSGGKDYDATVAGPAGYRAGYIWQNGGYVSVNCAPWVAYAAPFGVWAGWSIVTQPDYIQYPVYATYPVETAVEVALQKLGLYTGAIDGNAASCADAIAQYQTKNGMEATGTITPELLSSLGIQATAGP